MVLERFIMETALLPVFKFDLFGIGSLAQAGVNAAATAANNAVNAKIASDTNAANVAMNAVTNRANVAMNEATNATNRAIADEANALNLQMFNEQNEWNENMWVKQNEYNDPSNQMQRLIAAGINPNMIAASGSNPTGVAENAPTAASFAGAQMSTMNPGHVDPARIDPYRVAFESPDVLGALSQAAGISKTMAETENINIENQFKPDILGTEVEMQRESTRQIKAMTDDFIKANAYRMSQRKLDIAARQLENRAKKYNNQLLRQTIKERKAEFKEWKSLSGTRKYQAIVNLEKSIREIEQMDVEKLHMFAQEKHWQNQDALGSGQLSIAKQSLAFMAVDKVLKTCGLRADTRQKLSAAFAKDPTTSNLSQLLEGLDMAADGNFNNWFSAAMHDPNFVKLVQGLSAFAGQFLPNEEDESNIIFGGVR